MKIYALKYNYYLFSIFVSLMKYKGLRFTSKYVLDKYCPIIPKENNWIPLTINIIQTSEGHPLVGSPKIKVLKIITSINKNDTKQNIKPIAEEIRSGVVENAVIPSNAYFVNFQKDHFVVPATLWIFWYSSHFTS